MKEKWQVVIPVRVTAWCADCGGEMIATGLSYTVMPPLHEHRCDLCGRVETTTETYPRVQYHAGREPQDPMFFDLPARTPSPETP